MPRMLNICACIAFFNVMQILLQVSTVCSALLLWSHLCLLLLLHGQTMEYRGCIELYQLQGTDVFGQRPIIMFQKNLQKFRVGLYHFEIMKNITVLYLYTLQYVRSPIVCHKVSASCDALSVHCIVFALEFCIMRENM